MMEEKLTQEELSDLNHAMEILGGYPALIKIKERTVLLLVSQQLRHSKVTAPVQFSQ